MADEEAGLNNRKDAQSKHSAAVLKAVEDKKPATEIRASLFNFASQYHSPFSNGNKDAINGQLDALFKNKPEEIPKAIYTFMSGYALDDKLKKTLKALAEGNPAAPAPAAALASSADASQTQKDIAAEKTKLAELKKKIDALGKEAKEEEQKKKLEHEVKVAEATIEVMEARLASGRAPDNAELKGKLKAAEEKLGKLKGTSGVGGSGNWFESLKNGDISWGKAIAVLIAGFLGYSVVGGLFGNILGGGTLGSIMTPLLGIGAALVFAFGGAQLFDGLFGGSSQPASSQGQGAQQSGQGQGQGQQRAATIKLDTDLLERADKANTDHRSDVFRIAQDASGALKVMLIPKQKDGKPYLLEGDYLVTREVLRKYLGQGVPATKLAEESLAAIRQIQAEERAEEIRRRDASPTQAAAPAAAPATAAAAHGDADRDRGFLQGILAAIQPESRPYYNPAGEMGPFEEASPQRVTVASAHAAAPAR